MVLVVVICLCVGWLLFCAFSSCFQRMDYKTWLEINKCPLFHSMTFVYMCFSFDYYQIMVIVNMLCVSIAFGEVVIKLGKEQWVSGRYLP